MRLFPLLLLLACYPDDHARECAKDENADASKCYRWGYSGGYSEGYEKGADEAYQDAYDAGYSAAMEVCATTGTDSGDTGTSTSQ